LKGLGTIFIKNYFPINAPNPQVLRLWRMVRIQKASPDFSGGFVRLLIALLRITGAGATQGSIKRLFR
jgi:hypothetical protein